MVIAPEVDDDDAKNPTTDDDSEIQDAASDESVVEIQDARGRCVVEMDKLSSKLPGPVIAELRAFSEHATAWAAGAPSRGLLSWNLRFMEQELVRGIHRTMDAVKMIRLLQPFMDAVGRKAIVCIEDEERMRSGYLACSKRATEESPLWTGGTRRAGTMYAQPSYVCAPATAEAVRTAALRMTVRVGRKDTMLHMRAKSRDMFNALGETWMRTKDTVYGLHDLLVCTHTRRILALNELSVSQASRSDKKGVPDLLDGLREFCRTQRIIVERLNEAKDRAIAQCYGHKYYIKVIAAWFGHASKFAALTAIDHAARSSANPIDAAVQRLDGGMRDLRAPPQPDHEEQERLRFFDHGLDETVTGVGDPDPHFVKFNNGDQDDWTTETLGNYAGFGLDELVEALDLATSAMGGDAPRSSAEYAALSGLPEQIMNVLLKATIEQDQKDQEAQPSMASMCQQAMMMNQSPDSNTDDGSRTKLAMPRLTARQTRNFGPWDLDRYCAEARTQSHGFGPPDQYPLDLFEDDLFLDFHRLARYPPLTLSDALGGPRGFTYPDESDAYKVIAAWLYQASKLTWLKGRIWDLTGIHTGCGAALLEEADIMQALPRDAVNLLSKDSDGSPKIMVRFLIKDMMGSGQDNKFIAPGTVIPAWTGGAKEVCQHNDHIRHVPLYTGQRILFKIEAKQDPQVMNCFGRKPLLVADVWCMDNGLQPPTVTSCNVPSCAGYYDPHSVGLARWNRNLIPGWMPVARSKKGFGSYERKGPDFGIKAEEKAAAAYWPRTLLVLTGFADTAREKFNRGGIPQNWRTMSCEELQALRG